MRLLTNEISAAVLCGEKKKSSGGKPVLCVCMSE